MNKKDEMDPEVLMQSIQKFFLSQLTVKDVKKITNKEMEAVYAIAYNFYTHGQYGKASKVFNLLCRYDNYEVKYWVGLGAAAQMLKKHKNAVDAYTFAMVLNPLDARIHRYITDCFIALKDYKNAKKSLEATIMVCEEYKSENHQTIEADAKIVLEQIEKKIKKGKKGKKGGNKNV